MSNPLRAPKQEIVAVPDAAPSAYFTATDAFNARLAEGKSLQHLIRSLAPLDMVVAPTITIPKGWTVDAQIQASAKPSMALAKTGKPQFRVRSGPGYEALNALWGQLPDDGFGKVEAVAAAVKNKFYVDAGTEYTLGRLEKAYPKSGSRIARPITKAEAEAALDNCGLRVDAFPAHAVRAYPLRPPAGELGVTVNPKSDNGFPVLGQWDTPGAQDKIFRLTAAVRRDIVRESKGSTGVEKWVRDAEEGLPWLVALRGKAKADYYTEEKINGGMLRFYNAFPRQIVLNMQVATQPFEAVARSVDRGSHSAIGFSLHRGGAEELVAAMDHWLDTEAQAYVHVGDDSWVALREGEDIVMFALDCSNFDLTQHSECTAQVHLAIKRQLACIDAPAGDLWYAYARERLVVTAGAVTRRWKHAGPSGMPLQSKVNDMLMDVMINRALDGREAGWSEDQWDAHLKKVGTDMGFVVKVEQYKRMEAKNMKRFLAASPFLFIGYYFHVLEDQRIAVCADLPRTWAQMPYPGLKWIKGDHDMLVMEAMRLGSMWLSAGIPPLVQEKAFAAWRDTVDKQLTKALRQGDVQDDRLRWAVGQAVHGPDPVASLSGLLAALRRDPQKLWLEREPELLSSSVLVPVQMSWADMVDEDEEAELGTVLYVPPPSISLPAPPVLHPVRPTHPVTARNDGRPGPTAVWGPPKVGRARENASAPNRVRRIARVMGDEPYTESEYTYESDDEYDRWVEADFGAEDNFGSGDEDVEFRDRLADRYGNYRA